MLRGMSIPSEIHVFCTEHLGQVLSFEPASGGCINNGGKLTTSQGTFFIKWNSATLYPGMFAKEKTGLQLLRQAGGITVPLPGEVYEGHEYSCIVMEYIESGPRARRYWQQLAEGLASVHHVVSETYGLDHDNYMGSIVQYNPASHNWTDFFINARLEAQVKLARDHGRMDTRHTRLFKALYAKLDHILITEPPCLVHGDLWSGNIITSEQGEPALIDPAVSFAHREIDIAMTQLFGSLPREFYEVYNDVYPLAHGWQERLDVYNLYPLLVHVNLFGGGYLGQVMHILKGLVG